MKWKLVFNSDLKTPMWGHISKAAAAAKECGYKFFTWNTLVFMVTGEGWSDTGITSDDLI